MIVVNNVSFSYGNANILDNITIQITEDMFPLALVGPNGAGKTTLLKLISGILKPNEGDVVIWGHSVYKMKSKKRASLVGILFADKVVPVSLPVLDVVLSGLYRYTSLFEDKMYYKNKAIEIMERLDILHLKDRMFSNLSSGERQLVLIAMLMLQSPQIILMDEPTSFLDPLHRYLLVDIISLLSQQHKVLFTSHDIEFIKAVSQFTVGIKNGKIIYKGKTGKFLQEAFHEVFGIEYDRYMSVFGI